MTFTVRRKFLAIPAALFAVVLAATVTACSHGQNGNDREHRQQLADTATYENNQPIPHFNYSQQRQNLIDIEAMQSATVQTTTFWMNYGDPDPVGSCPSIGFGIPESASLSNPEQVANPSDRSSTAIGQMDPNGIYAPTTGVGTYVICLTSSGQPYIDRIESTVDTYGGPAVWNYAKHRGELVGAPTAAAKVLPPEHRSGK